MSSYSFTADSVTIAGRTFPAGYSVTPSGSVVVFVTLPDAAETARIRFTPDHADHAAALAAAQAVKPATEDKPAAEDKPKRKTARKSKPEPIPAAEPVQEPAPEPPAEDVPQPEPEPAPEPIPAAEPVHEPAPEPPAEETTPRRAAVPEKDFIGETITGHGWRIFFDGETSRTRVIFDADPTDAARAALDKAGFYFSPVMKSYNKKLTHKAHRAAVALSGELRTLYA